MGKVAWAAGLEGGGAQGRTGTAAAATTATADVRRRGRTTNGTLERIVTQPPRAGGCRRVVADKNAITAAAR